MKVLQKDHKQEILDDIKAFEELEEWLIPLLRKRGMSEYDIGWNNEIRRYRSNVRKDKKVLELYYG